MTTPNCLFCKIVSEEVPADVVYQNDHVIAFRDINPQAPTHVLIIPRRHVATINDLTPAVAGDIGELFLAAREIAAEAGIADNGYRVAMNCNDDGGQSVYHLHLHLLGGRRMSWPPG